MRKDGLICISQLCSLGLLPLEKKCILGCPRQKIRYVSHHLGLSLPTPGMREMHNLPISIPSRLRILLPPVRLGLSGKTPVVLQGVGLYLASHGASEDVQRMSHPNWLLAPSPHFPFVSKAWLLGQHPPRRMGTMACGFQSHLDLTLQSPRVREDTQLGLCPPKLADCSEPELL